MVFSLICRITGARARCAPETIASACSSWITLKAAAPVPSARAASTMEAVETSGMSHRGRAEYHRAGEVPGDVGVNAARDPAGDGQALDGDQRRDRVQVLLAPEPAGGRDLLRQALRSGPEHPHGGAVSGDGDRAVPILHG